MSNSSSPLVYLVGAGPGHPALLTVRAAECLARAELVLYDKLVSRRLLDYAPQAECLCISDLPGKHPDHYPSIHQAMIEGARQGKRVVRLKGGDPFIFGRGGEEAEVLREHGIPFEIVPGVTAGLGASACAGIPLTHRAHSSSVTFVTGHENPLKGLSLVDWAALARTPGTLVIYMGIARLNLIVEALVQNGKAANTPAAAVQWATTSDQRTVEAPLVELPQAIQNAGLVAPSIVIIGSVVSLRPRVAWFEQRPLFGKRVLVTRPRHQAADLVRRLDEQGAFSYVLPVVEITEPTDWTPVDHAIAALSRYQWVVFTSVNGVEAFVKRLRHQGRDLRALGTVKLAAIGPSTADALRRYHLEPDLVPEEYRSERLAEALRERVRGQRVLLARADRGRDILRQELATVAEVEQVAVYHQVDLLSLDSEVLDCLRRGEIDYVTLTSANIARAFVRALDATCRDRILAGHLELVSISPVTSGVIRELGLPVAAEATEYTMGGVVDALVGLVRTSSEQANVPTA